MRPRGLRNVPGEVDRSPFVYPVARQTLAAGAQGVGTVNFDALYQRFECEEIAVSCLVTTPGAAVAATDLDILVRIELTGGKLLQTNGIFISAHDCFGSKDRRRVYNPPLCFRPNQTVTVTFLNPHGVEVITNFQFIGYQIFEQNSGN